MKDEICLNMFSSVGKTTEYTHSDALKVSKCSERVETDTTTKTNTKHKDGIRLDDTV